MNFKVVHWWIRRIWIGGGVLFLLALLWNVQAHGVRPELYASGQRVRAQVTDYGRTFRPEPVTGTPAFVFVPGGLIDPNAYVPLARAVAEAGVPAAIVNVPWRAAPTDQTRAVLWARIRQAREDVGNGQPVVLGGHSRGGMLASEFAADRPDDVAALVLVGTTHPRDRDLSAARWPVLKIAGSADCVAPMAGSRANQALLPGQTQWLEIDGANHRQFGYYGWQIGDCRASISREEQHRRVVEAVVSLVRSLD